MYLAAVALAAAASSAPAPVEVVTREVTLARHDRAPIELRCNRTHRACRGVLRLGVPQCSDVPVAQTDCLLPVGRRRFAIPRRATRTVVVPRSDAAERAGEGPDALVVRATPVLRGASARGVRRWERTVRLVAPASVARPALPLQLRQAQRLHYERDAVRFLAGAPSGTSSVTVELAGRQAELHPRGFEPYVVGLRSFAVVGTLWHGELPVGYGELRPGERHGYRLTACTPLRCTATSGEVTLDRDRTRDPQPICRLRPLTATL